MKENEQPLIVIVGPTAVGKTELSLRLAEQFNGEIVSADSRLFYRKMDIGTAKPSLEDRARVCHHLVDVALPDDVWSLARYLPRAIDAIQDIQRRGKLPFLVGGTGQYIMAVVQGWDLPEAKPDPALREVLNDWAEIVGVEGLRSRLRVLDPSAAAGIDGPNLRRIVRALEVILSTGERFSDQKTRQGSPFDLLQIGLIRPREELYQRIDQRVDNMLDAGLVQEVRSLLEKGYSPELSSLSAIGYKQITSYLLGRCSLDEAVRQIKSKTRKYVRQQANWFQQNDPEISWFSASNDPFQEICEEIRQFLS
jgi:tRNA dimethylallyltransferase